MAFRVIFLLVAIVIEIGGVSVPSLAECAVDYISLTESDDRVKVDCDARIQSESAKFYDEIEGLIRSGVNVEHLENSNFQSLEGCIMTTLRAHNVSNIFLKGLAYQHLNKVRPRINSYHVRMSPMQILLMYALQVCEPRSFYERNAERIFSMNTRTTDEQANCLLNHLNENSVDEHYQFLNTTLIGESDSKACNAIVKNFIRKYYYVLDKARNFTLFNLHPAEAIKCRATNDKNLINNMILLTIVERLQFTPEQIEVEKIRFFEIARETAQSFFKCISFYD